MKKIIRLISLFFYYCFAQYLPDSYTPIFGKPSNFIRIFLCRRIFKYCGKRVLNINRHAFFGFGTNVEIGDFSSIGANCVLHPNVKIGQYVMMGPETYIVGNNHITADVNTPMCFQGKTENKVTVIEDDVWIGARVMIMPGRKIGKGSILAAGAVVTKDVPSLCVFGGNPAKLIRRRGM